MEQQGDTSSADVVMDEGHILAAQPGRKQVLYRQPGGAELVRSEDEAESEDDVDQSEAELRALHDGPLTAEPQL